MPTLETVYIAGKMTGEPQFGFLVFDAAAQDLREKGYGVVSPAELDDPKIRARCLASSDGVPQSGDTSWGQLLARDIIIVADQVQGVAVLPKWNKSRGARLETFVAFLCGKPVVHYPSMRKVRKRDLIAAWLGDLAKN